jgi:hypothetical protein
LIRLLAKIGFKRAILKYAFEFQSKPKGFEGLSEKFFDSEGRKYYSYDNDLDIPIPRLAVLQKTLMELKRAMTEDELEKFITYIEAALDEALKPKKGSVGVLARIGHITGEMRLRHEELIHEELLIKLAAVVYIREDENPGTCDEDILNQKVRQFIKDTASGGLYGFFMQDGLKRYLPFVDMSIDEWENYLTSSQSRMKAQADLMNQYISAQQSSTNKIPI